MKQSNSNDNPWRAVALTSAIGIDFAVCVGLGYWVGQKFSEWLGHPMWLFAGLLLGLAASVGSIYLLIKHYGGL